MSQQCDSSRLQPLNIRKARARIPQKVGFNVIFYMWTKTIFKCLGLVILIRKPIFIVSILLIHVYHFNLSVEQIDQVVGMGYLEKSEVNIQGGQCIRVLCLSLCMWLTVKLSLYDLTYWGNGHTSYSYCDTLEVSWLLFLIAVMVF